MSEEAQKKIGPELFKELLRLYSTAEVDDYYKAGQWKNELMKNDLILIAAHRKEAGAPDPPSLEDVVMPDMPGGGVMSLGGVGPAGALGAAQAGAGGPVAELRLIALFVAKWKLDPSRAKMVLAKLTPGRRRYVISNFKTAGGESAITDLEKYIEDCGKSGVWDTAPAAAPMLARPAAVPAVRTIAGVRPPAQIVSPRPALSSAIAAAGVKRPALFLANPALDPSKRPRIGVPAVGPLAGRVAPAAVATSALSARLAASRAAAGRPASPAHIMPRPVVTTPGSIRPVGAVQPGARPVAGKPQGALIRNLLQKM